MIRPYLTNDKEELISILRLLTPTYFDVSEENDFAEYLEKHLEKYFVVEGSGKVIGSGGINYFDDLHLARLSWDLIHPEHQGKGIGRKLTRYRINEIKKNAAIHQIQVRTTQLVYPFYQKSGFTLEKTEKDFWAKGLDLYQMKLDLG